MTDVENLNLPDAIYQSFNANLNPCKLFDSSIEGFSFNRNNIHLFEHLNICSQQAHFDESNELILKLPILPSIIFFSETRINMWCSELYGNVFSHSFEVFSHVFIRIGLANFRTCCYFNSQNSPFHRFFLMSELINWKTGI